jgi:hypothetical protein
MKKILILCLLLAFTGNAFSQVDTAVSNSSIKTDYLKKSKNQKTIAWVLLGSGTALMITGALVSNNAVENDPLGTLYGVNKDANTGAILFIVGGVAGLTSIPFFVAGSKNKQRALSVSFKNESVPLLKKNALVHLSLPSVSLVLEL